MDWMGGEVLEQAGQSLLAGSIWRVSLRACARWRTYLATAGVFRGVEAMMIAPAKDL
jgi:hypothetical protein